MMYRVTIGTGLAWTYSEEIEGFNESDAVDNLADKLEGEGCGFISTYSDIEKLCDEGQTVEEYAEANGLTCCGNHGVYLELIAIEELA